jgi:hypothetical protein
MLQLKSQPNSRGGKCTSRVHAAKPGRFSRDSRGSFKIQVGHQRMIYSSLSCKLKNATVVNKQKADQFVFVVATICNHAGAIYNGDRIYDYPVGAQKYFL